MVIDVFSQFSDEATNGMYLTYIVSTTDLMHTPMYLFAHVCII